MNAFRLSVMFLVGASLACSDAPQAEDASEPEPQAEVSTADARVTITGPEEGAVIIGDQITVELSVTGVVITPAGEIIPGTGHHHLYLDADLTDGSVPVPSVPGSIIHMGDGASEYTFEGVAPGEHRLIAVIADGVHMPVQPWVVDTINFTVN
jgi:uncharacterized protein DUF4399